MKKQKQFLAPCFISWILPGPSLVQAATSGTVMAWGWNGYDQTTIPITAQSGVTAIAACGEHTVALKSDGSVVAWGPTESVSVNGVTAMAVGSEYSVILKTNGMFGAWGRNENGQVTGSPTWDYPEFRVAIPVTLAGHTLTGVTAIAAGEQHTVAIIGTAPLRPSLQARSSGNELVLSWSTNFAVGYTLQSTLALTPPVTWIDSTNAPTMSGGQFTVTNAVFDGSRFYRLTKP